MVMCAPSTGSRGQEVCLAQSHNPRLKSGLEADAPGRVEITGPTDRKMVINALNSGAKTFMADLEGESGYVGITRIVPSRLTVTDSTSPTWSNVVHGQKNLYDAIRRQIDFESNGKQYKLSEKPAVLLVR